MKTETFIFFAGVFQIVLVSVSSFIPSLLNWKKELSGVSPLIRQMFWTYAGYILGINFFFGLISLWSPESLLNGSFLAKAFTLLISAYWLVRVAVQFFYFDRKSAPQGPLYFVGEMALVALFIFLTGVYGWSFYVNIK